MELSQSDGTFTLDELAQHADLPRRTLRYYIQLGLMDRPVGETRAAYYTAEHLRQLLEIRRLTAEGFSLERVRELMSGQSAPPAAAPRTGSVAVRTHIHLADGIELVVEPGRAALSPEGLRRFAREALAAYERARKTAHDDTNGQEP